MPSIDWIAEPPQAGSLMRSFRPAHAQTGTSAVEKVRAAIGAGLDTKAQRSDSALVKAAQGGSEEALEVLFRRHWRAAHRAAFLVVHDIQAAEDIAQESFLAAIRALDRFDRRRPFRPWLHRIVVNRAIDHTRARTLRREVSEVPDLAVAAEDTGSRLGDDLLEALAALGSEHRAVVILRYLLDYTPGEIAKMLDLPRGTVNSRLRRALDSLGASLEKEER